jgi:hypothetical protein
MPAVIPQAKDARPSKVSIAGRRLAGILGVIVTDVPLPSAGDGRRLTVPKTALLYWREYRDSRLEQLEGRLRHHPVPGCIGVQAVAEQRGAPGLLDEIAGIRV